jgi:hypothetical protein
LAKADVFAESGSPLLHGAEIVCDLFATFVGVVDDHFGAAANVLADITSGTFDETKRRP